MLSRPQVDLTFERIRFLAPCQRLRAIVCVLSAHLRRVLKSTCVCLRFREQCLRSEITSVSRVALVLLLRFAASNMDVNTPASKRSQLIGNTAIVRKRCVIHTNSTCVCWRLSVPRLRRNARTQASTCGRLYRRQNARVDHSLLEKLTLFPNASIVLEDADTHRSNFRRRVNAQTKRRQSHVNAGTVPESENART